ncbi:MAG: HAMP domain-containing sensor histidine kinase [bacterium]
MAYAAVLATAGILAALFLASPAPSGLELSDIVPGMIFVYAMAWWAVAASQAARSRAGWERTVWWWFAASGYASLVFTVAIAGTAAVEGPKLAAQAATAVLSTSLYGMLLAGFVILSTRQARRGQTARLLLDAAIIAGSLFFVLWGAVYRDLFDASALDVVTRLQLVLFPAFDSLLLAVAALNLIGRDDQRPRAYRILLVGLALLVLTDLASAPLTLADPDLGGRLYLIGDLLAMILLILAAVAIRKGPAWLHGPQRQDSLPLRLLPVIPLALAMMTAVWTVLEHGVISNVQFWLSVGIIALVMVRLVITIVQNATLEQRLRGALDDRTQLLRFVSHELANPLAPLVLQARLLRTGGHADAAPALDIVDRSVSRLRRLSDDVRDLARAETGRFLGALQDTDLVPLAQAAVRSAAAPAGAKGITLRLVAPEPAPCMADAERLGQVLDNLLSNAIKYTPTGGDVEITVTHSAAGAGCVVKDNGMGLDPDDAAQLFEPFRRFHRESAPGLGLGLYLCRAIVEAHGGRIEAESAGVGQGAAFRFTLPGPK